MEAILSYINSTTELGVIKLDGRKNNFCRFFFEWVVEQMENMIDFFVQNYVEKC